MHELFEKADVLTHTVLAAAIEVHREKGSGLLESIYERCLAHELALAGVVAVSQKSIAIRYKDLVFDESLRFDLLVADCLLIEVKSVERTLPVHKAQLFSYMKLLNIPVGLLLNFHDVVLKTGISRMILPGANLP